MSNKSLNITLFAISVFILLIAINLLFSILFGNIHFDTTRDKKYTLTQETKEFLSKNNETISIRFYVSNSLKNKNLIKYARELRKLFDEYRKYGNGNIELIIVEVKPFTNTQAQAEKTGIKEFDFGDGVKHQYLGASFSNGKGKTLVIPQFIPDRQSFVEDDITRILSRLSSRKIVLGVLSSYFKVVENKHGLSTIKAWPFIEQLELAGYEIVRLSESSLGIDDRIDALLVFYPMNLDAIGKYAIDQYLMRGGNVIMMLDAFAEERFRDKDEFFVYNSGVQDLLANLGVLHLDNILVGDNVDGKNIVLDGRLVQYPFKMVIKNGNIKEHGATKGIDKLFVDHSGFFEFEKIDGIDTKVLFATSEQSGIMLAKNVVDISYDNLIKNYETTETSYPLALMLEGKFRSLYDKPIFETETALQQMPPFLTIPLKEAKMALIADVDMLSEISWNERADSKARGYEVVYSSDNLKFLRNLIDYMTNSNFVNVPVKKIEMKKNSLADMFFYFAKHVHAKQKDVMEENLVEVKNKILLLQEQYGKVNMPSIKQAKDIERLQREEIDIMRELRKISYQTKEAYESYLVWFAVLMMAVYPLILTILVALIYICYRKKVSVRAKEMINA